jgi:hypothetical protein
MRDNLPLRLLLAAALSLAFAVLLVVLLYATDLALSLWARLKDMPLWFVAGYVTAIAFFALAAGAVVLRVLFPRRRPAPAPEPPAPADEETVRAGLEQAAARGLTVPAAAAEVAEVERRREAGEIHVVLFGQVSTGKSSLIKALLPDARVETDPRGGTTRAVGRHRWQSPGGDQLVLVDLPGLNEADGTLSPLARDEAIRAHVVVYLCDGDLTRDQYQELQTLAEFHKPLVVAINKADLYGAADLALIRERVTERVDAAEGVEVVTVSAGAPREVTVIHPDGREELVQRPSPPRVADLAAAIQRAVDRDPEALERLRDAAVFNLAGRKLDAAVSEHRRERAAEIVASSTRRAVVGALAAVSPGTDVLIQGVLGYQMVRRLCELYEAPVRQVDIEQVLKQASGRVGKALPVTLAVAGNALKAFPGVGTLAGGITHAVAYGLLFDTLGRAVARTLESRGELPAAVVNRTIEDTLREDLEDRARRLAKIALGQAAEQRRDRAD